MDRTNRDGPAQEIKTCGIWYWLAYVARSLGDILKMA
jgi:hypothetical protein